MQIGKGNVGFGAGRQVYNNVFANAKKAQIENETMNNSNKEIVAKDKANNDTIQINDEAAQLNAEKEKLNKIKEEQAREAREIISKQIQALREADQLKEQAKNAKAQGDAMGEALGDLGKCMTIAGRIMNGDKVPLKDEQFLAEKQPEMYSRAITLRKLNEDPKEYESLLEDEEEEGAPDTSGENPEIAELESLMAASGGGSGASSGGETVASGNEGDIS